MTDPKTMRTGPDGLALIKASEGFAPRLYNDEANDCTVGFGFKVHPGPVDGRESEQPYVGGITEAAAFRLLLDAVHDRAEVYIWAAVKVPLTQGQFDALASFCYNVGAGVFMGSTLLKRLNAGDVAGAAGEFARWNLVHGRQSDGLTKRRAAEAALFLSGQVQQA